MLELAPPSKEVTDNELAHLYGQPLIPYHLRSCLTETGVNLPPDMPFEDWSSLVTGLQVAHKVLGWSLVDALVYGRDTYHDRFEEAIILTGAARQTLYNMASLGYRIKTKEFRAALSISHHEVVASCAPDEQVRLLSLAAENEMTVRELREHKNQVANTVKRLTGESAEPGAELHGFASVEFVTNAGWKLTPWERQEVVRAWNEVDELVV